MPELEIVEKFHGDIVLNQPDYLHIVINGRLVLRYHENDPLEYQNIG